MLVKRDAATTAFKAGKLFAQTMPLVDPHFLNNDTENVFLRCSPDSLFHFKCMSTTTFTTKAQSICFFLSRQKTSSI